MGIRWKRTVCDEDRNCASRGCSIPAGTQHWTATWKNDDRAQVTAHYCPLCAAGSQAHSGETVYGLLGSLLLALIFLIVLPVLWPRHWPLWVALFVVVYAATAVITTRLFLRFYPSRRSKSTANAARERASVAAGS